MKYTISVFLGILFGSLILNWILFNGVLKQRCIIQKQFKLQQMTDSMHDSDNAQWYDLYLRTKIMNDSLIILNATK